MTRLKTLMKDVTIDEMLWRAERRHRTKDVRMRLLSNTLWGKGTQGIETSEYLQEKKSIEMP